MRTKYLDNFQETHTLRFVGSMAVLWVINSLRAISLVAISLHCSIVKWCHGCVDLFSTKLFHTAYCLVFPEQPCSTMLRHTPRNVLQHDRWSLYIFANTFLCSLSNVFHKLFLFNATHHNLLSLSWKHISNLYAEVFISFLYKHLSLLQTHLTFINRKRFVLFRLIELRKLCLCLPFHGELFRNVSRPFK